MGTANPGFDGTLEVSTNDSTYNSVGGANTFTQSRTFEQLDATDFDDTAMSRVNGLKDVSFELGGNYDSTDTGQADIITQFDAGNTIYVRYTTSAGTGYKAQCNIESYEVTSAPDGKEEFTVSCVGSDGTGWTSF